LLKGLDLCILDGQRYLLVALLLLEIEESEKPLKKILMLWLEVD
jgi:hypothetical protein